MGNLINGVYYFPPYSKDFKTKIISKTNKDHSINLLQTVYFYTRNIYFENVLFLNTTIW